MIRRNEGNIRTTADTGFICDGIEIPAGIRICPLEGCETQAAERVFASLKSVLPGMISQKQGTTQFNGSPKRGSRVSLANSGSSESTDVGLKVDESEAVCSVAVIAGVGVKVGIVLSVVWGIVWDGGTILWVGCIVAPTGTHPAKAKTNINKECGKSQYPKSGRI